MFNENDGIYPSVRRFDGHDWFSTKVNRRNLPHWELKGSTYFITSRLISSVGKLFVNESLARCLEGIIVKGHIDKLYYLHCYVIMPDHLHLILKPNFNASLPSILKKVKGGSAFQINKLLKREGKVWQTEYFDHLIRDQISFNRFVQYIKDNPFKAGFVKDAQDYPYSSFAK